MLALSDVGDNLADVFAVLHGRVAGFQIDESNLMADWHGMLCGQPEGRVVMGDAAQHVGPKRPSKIAAHVSRISLSV